ncbi:MAG: aryl-sulfate sulfotransferase, partial [Anaerolineae bacterium]
VWDFEYANSQHRLHHDIEPLPDGNVLMIAWEYKTEAEALAAGRDPALLADSELWPDTVIEVDPDTDTIVWEWHVWDHLVQDYDAGRDNFGVVADHPELINLNYNAPGIPPGDADWNHVNAVDYNVEFDQILLSVHNFSEIWVIDHSTTTAKAAGHSGGDSGQGGDLLYRWGNPAAYDAGDPSDQQLFAQHDARWIPAGYPGAGRILVFNNGTGRPGGNYSSVDEIVPPVDSAGHYTSYGPSAPAWTYRADNPTDFYATNISGAQRLLDGSTLICDGPDGYFFQVTPAGDVVWEYDYGGSVFRITRYAADYAGLPDMSTRQNAAPAVDAGATRPATPSSGANRPSMPGQQPAGDQGQRPDLAAAAQKLGVSVETLRAALGEPGQGPPDLAAAAAQLNVSLEALREALGLPGAGPTLGQRPGD